MFSSITDTFFSMFITSVEVLKGYKVAYLIIGLLKITET